MAAANADTDWRLVGLIEEFLGLCSGDAARFLLAGAGPGRFAFFWLTAGRAVSLLATGELSFSIGFVFGSCMNFLVGATVVIATGFSAALFLLRRVNLI